MFMNEGGSRTPSYHAEVVTRPFFDQVLISPFSRVNGFSMCPRYVSLPFIGKIWTSPERLGINIHLVKVPLSSIYVLDN